MQILFSWNKGDLILQARNLGDSQVLQLIPQSVLLGDFPRHLVDEYIHWLDLSTGQLEFRPAKSPWMTEPSNWRLYIQREGCRGDSKKPGNFPRGLLQKTSRGDSPIQAIDIRSSTFAVVSSLMSPLETADHIIATHTARSFEVFLPRLHLSFFLNMNWELECRSLPGYVIDKTQSCGTMFGLRNKLILCPCLSSFGEPLLRRVIIPQGDISYSRDGDFANISINTDAGQHVRWHEYTIDTDLGCLTSNTTLSSKLYQCYLHALTSHCLPDPLLGQSGTEEALCMLRSTACRSFQRLDIQEAILLELISKLSPDRKYSSQLTASVKWDDLPVLSQHYDFFQAVCSIIDHACALETLYHPPAIFNTFPRNQHLLNRAAFRNKLHYPSDLHISEQPLSPDEVKYMSDVSGHETTELVAYRTSWSIWNDRPSLDPRLPELWMLMNSWGSLGPGRPASSEVSLRYSRYWVDFEVARDWIVIYDLCRKAGNLNRRRLKIELSFSLSAAAYRRANVSMVTDFLVIFALDERFRELSPPSDPSYTLSHGLIPDRTELQNIILKSTLTASLTYVEIALRGSSAVTESILSQWPHHKPVSHYIPRNWPNRLLCIQRIAEYLLPKSQNFRLREHVSQLQRVLQYYGTVSTPTVRLMPYRFSPQFSAGQSNAPSYSLCNLLTSCTNVPTISADTGPSQGRVIFPTEEIASATAQTGSESFKILIEELQQSRQPILQQYGDTLNRSHRELLGNLTFQSAGGGVPSHADLLLYHKDCSQRKSKIFSEISAALAPSQIVEETSHIAGLWPRITPRSILRQLARDRIGVLSDQWKTVIVRYAVSFLKYQQSLRMLELSSRQNRQELLQEIEAIRHGVLVESTPDWLLVQVCPFPS
jgi:hypothetical protein